MNIAICDDVKKEAELLETLCHELNYLHTTLFLSGEEFLSSPSLHDFNILFLDISCQSDTFGESWAFINPNAHNPLTTHDINMLFKFNNSIIDDFQHDNY